MTFIIVQSSVCSVELSCRSHQAQPAWTRLPRVSAVAGVSTGSWLVRRDLECPWAGSWLAFSCGNRGAWIMCLFWSRRVPIKAAEFLQSETPGAQAWDWDVFSSAFCYLNRPQGQLRCRGGIDSPFVQRACKVSYPRGVDATEKGVWQLATQMH